MRTTSSDDFTQRIISTNPFLSEKNRSTEKYLPVSPSPLVRYPSGADMEGKSNSNSKGLAIPGRDGEYLDPRTLSTTPGGSIYGTTPGGKSSS